MINRVMTGSSFAIGATHEKFLKDRKFSGTIPMHAPTRAFPDATMGP